MKSISFKLLSIICIFSCINTSVSATEHTNGFIENKGQFADKNGKIRNDINFKLEQPNVNAYFKPNGIIYHFYKSTEKPTENYSKEEIEHFKKGDLAAISKTVQFFRLDLNLLGANPNANYFPDGVQDQKYNYYLAHCPKGITNVNSFNGITYQNIYPNIDIKYYFVDGKLKYEFIVHPGGDITKIKFKYDGTKSTNIVDGKLKIETSFNTIIEDEPYCYYKKSKKEITSKFNLEGETVSFNLHSFDVNETIIIDPTITWASYYSNAYSSDFHCNSAFDSQANIYTAFATYGTTWPTINAGGTQYYDAIKDGITDLVIAKINSNYSKQWATYYGGDGGDYLCGTGGDYGKTLGIDANNDLYVGGYTSSATIFPTLASSSGGAFYQDQTKLYGGDNSFLLKFDGNGIRQWATMFQHEQANTNSAGMRINGICVKGTKIYFTGQTYRFNNNDMPLRTLAGAYNNSTFVGDQDIFIGRFNSNCVLEWSSYFNGGNTANKAYKQGSDLHIDASGNLLFVGQISGTAAANGASAYLLNPGGAAYYNGLIAGSIDIQVAKFNSSMQPIWSTHYGGTDLDRVSEVSSDINGNILVACRTVGGPGFPTANPGGAFYYSTKQSPGTWSGAAGSADGGIMKFTPAGVLYWATYVGGTNASTNSITGIASDNSGNIYALGYTYTSDFPTQNLAGSYNQPALSGTVDLVLMKFTTGGALSWSTYYGGSGSESCYGVKLTPATKYGSCNNYKQFNAFSTTSPNDLPTVNPGAPAFYESTKPTTNANAVILIEELGSSGNSTNPTSILGTTIICAPNSTTLNLNGGTLASSSVWTWHTGGCTGPVIGTGTSITVSPISTTTYYINAIGTCDTTACISVTVTVNSNVTGSYNQSICSGSSYLFNGINLTTAGAYKDTLTASGGCDSIVTLNLSITPNVTGSFNHTICTGSSYLFNGINLTTAGAYKDTLTASGGCDSIVTLNLSITPNVTGSFNHTICTGSSYLFNGINLTTAGAFKDTLTASGGCDSIVTLNLSIIPNVTGSFNHTICTGSSYLFNGIIYTTAGAYKDTLIASGGCDSIVTLNLSITPNVTGSFNHTICTGSSYLFNGINLTTAGAYKDTLTASGGCDSIVTLNLSITPNVTGNFSQSICTGSSYLFNGINLTAAGAYKDTLTASGGCDSIVTLNLSLTPNVTGNFSQSICTGSSYLFNGQNLTTAGNYLDTLTSSSGCDSIITFNLLVISNSSSNQSATICSGELYTLPNGNIVSVAGTYKDTVPNWKGCDSIISFTLIVNTTPTAGVSSDITITSGTNTTLTASGGGTYNWNPSLGLNTTTGSTVIATPAQTTTYCVIVTNANGCMDTACVTITVESNCPSAENLAIPNAFSPNNDNVNDEFCLQGWNNCIKDFTITIFDRWGEKVFESKDPNFCWDGIWNGIMPARPAVGDAQVFVYYINAKHIVSGEKFNRSGNISLLR